MEDNLKRKEKWNTTSKKMKMEDDLEEEEKWKTT